MSSTSSHSELLSLLDAALAETLTPAQHERLQSLLRDDAGAQTDYFDYLDVHLGLKQLVLSADSEAGEPSLAAGLPCGQAIPELATSSLAHRVSRRGWGAVAALGLAVALTGTFMAGSLCWRGDAAGTQPVVATASQTGTSPEKIAVRLSQMSKAEFFGELIPPIASELTPHHSYALIKGTVELTYPSGAQATIQAPAVFSIDSPESLRLKIGGCSVHAPDGAQGFQVMTPRSQIVDLGTRFFVGVDDLGQSELQVIEGAARLQTQDSGQDVEKTLLAGEALRDQTTVRGTQAIQFDAGRYISRLPDRVISYEASSDQPGGPVRDLRSVTVQRGGKSFCYAAEDLIGIEVLHFAGSESNRNVAWMGEFPSRPAETLERDFALNTGLLNPGGRTAEERNRPVPDDFRTRPGIAFRFRQPVINGPGPDVVLFELQSPVYPIEGDRFRVGPLAADATLHDHLVTCFDITLRSRNAMMVQPFQLSHLSRVPQSLEELSHPDQELQTHFSLDFSALAVGIDLSDLGYSENAAVTGLFIEDAHDDDNIVDPVLIGGFPWSATPGKDVR